MLPENIDLCAPQSQSTLFQPADFPPVALVGHGRRLVFAFRIPVRQLTSFTQNLDCRTVSRCDIVLRENTTQKDQRSQDIEGRDLHGALLCTKRRLAAEFGERFLLVPTQDQLYLFYINSLTVPF